MEIKSQLKINKKLSKIQPEVCYSGLVVTDSTWRQEPLYASYSRIYYIMEGSGMLVSDKEKMPLEAGYVYLAPCGLKCGFYGTPSVSKVFFHVNLSLGDGEGDVFESFGRFAKFPMPIKEMRRLEKWYLADNPYSHLMVKNEIYRAICEFLKTAEDKDGTLRSYSKPVTDAMNYIRSHLTANLTVGEISEASLCSKSTLSLMFKREVGQSVAKYIDDLLMSEAQTLIIYSDLSIGQISERLGFCDQFYFSRWFFRRFDASPKEYRKISKE